VTLIDRYVLSAFLRVLAWSLLSFVAVFLLVDLFDHIDNFLDDNATVWEVARYYFYQLPLMVDLCLPVGMLLASLFTIGSLSKNNEYSALLSAGVSLTRLSRALIVLGLLISVGSLVFREYVVPPANRRQEEVRKYDIEGKIRQDLQGKRNFTYIGQGGEVYVIAAFRPSPPILQGFSMQVMADSVMVRRVDAERAVWDEESGRWVAEQGAVRTFDAGAETVVPFDRLVLQESRERPEDFSRREVDPENMNWFELRDFARWVGRNGGNPTPYRAEMAHKVAFPMVNVLLVFLGLALGAARRKTTLWAGFGLTMGLGFGYWILMDFGLTLGRSGALPILLSAWTPNALYGSMGLLLFWRANR
jgi:lipopolysaccharide export system permease protein